MKKFIIGGIIAVVVVGGLVVALMLQPLDQQRTVSDAAETPTSEDTSRDTTQSDDLTNDVVTLQPGRYEDYDESHLGAEGYNETIIFFHAPWCPECRAFEQAILASDIPDGVQILKTDYDSSTELRQKYEITLQSTFVKVDSSGDELTMWVGYGKDKSVTAILENT